MSCDFSKSTCNHSPFLLPAAHQRVAGLPSTASLAKFPLPDSSELAVTFPPVAAFFGTLETLPLSPLFDCGLGLVFRSNDSFLGIATSQSSRLVAQRMPRATKFR